MYLHASDVFALRCCVRGLVVSLSFFLCFLGMGGRGVFTTTGVPVQPQSVPSAWGYMYGIRRRLIGCIKNIVPSSKYLTWSASFSEPEAGGETKACEGYSLLLLPLLLLAVQRYRAVKPTHDLRVTRRAGLVSVMENSQKLAGALY